MLSCTREAAPAYVIAAPPGKYVTTLGHTGVSIREYIVKSAEMARRRRVTVEIEADHLIVGSYVQAVQRLFGSGTEVRMTEKERLSSISFVCNAIDEAISTRLVNAFTVDTTSLFDSRVEKYSKEELARKFISEIPNPRALLEEYSCEFRFSWLDGSLHTVSFTKEDIMRMALQFKPCLETTWKIYSHVREGMGGRPFGFELTFDELPKRTGKELLYYLREWRKMGAHSDFVAPNIGFRKRADFNGDLGALKRQLSFLAALAYGSGMLLSIHSGSGYSPNSRKGRGVYQTIVEATGGKVKYKISGVYFELLMHILARSKTHKHRRLFEMIFNDVSGFWESEIAQNTSLADNTVRNMLRSRHERRAKLRDRSDFFRHYSFVALNLRDKSGKRYLKDDLLALYDDDRGLRRLVDKEVEKLTLGLIDGMNFSSNLTRHMNSVIRTSMLEARY